MNNPRSSHLRSPFAAHFLPPFPWKHLLSSSATNGAQLTKRNLGNWLLVRSWCSVSHSACSESSGVCVKNIHTSLVKKGGEGERENSESALNEPQLHGSSMNCQTTSITKIVQLDENSRHTVNWDYKNHSEENTIVKQQILYLPSVSKEVTRSLPLSSIPIYK